MALRNAGWLTFVSKYFIYYSQLIPMPRTGLSKEESRQLILEKADELFRRYGVGKTTIADIAGDLRMSPANIYKFFPSKNAIVQACAGENIRKLKTLVLSKVRGSGSAFERLENVVLTVFHFQHELLRNERQIFHIVQTAREEAWPCIADYDTFIVGVFHQLIEEGIRTGEFRKDLPPDSATILRDCVNVLLHPHHRREFRPDENDAHVRAQLRFLRRALE